MATKEARRIAELMARAVVDVEALLITERPHVLTDTHPAAGRLVAQLLKGIDAGIRPCVHMAGHGPRVSLWSPGMGQLGCQLDLIAFTSTTTSFHCDACGIDAGRARLRKAVVGVGPVGIIAGVCRPCFELRAPRRIADFRAAGDAIINLLLEEATG